jgi:hypothetical protein
MLLILVVQKESIYTQFQTVVRCIILIVNINVFHLLALPLAHVYSEHIPLAMRWHMRRRNRR